MQIFGLVAFIKQKENDNNDNLCKIHGGHYIASALMKTTSPMEDSSELFQKKKLMKKQIWNVNMWNISTTMDFAFLIKIVT